MDSRDFTLLGIKILIIDDEPDSLEIIKLILTNHHAGVIAVANAVEALAQLQRHRPDVIVSDISMPCMDGYEFIREVRSLPADQGGQTPAIAITAFNRAEDRIRAIDAGFQKHLSKPIDLQILLDTIASVSGR